jgi:hypothetical protein
MSPSSVRSTKPIAARQARRSGKPFFGAIESVIVEDPVDFEFDGAISREHAQAAWTWMVRDLAPGQIDADADPDDPRSLAALDALLPDLLVRVRDALAAAAQDPEAERRLKTQLGGQEQFRRLPLVVAALKCRNLLDKAKAFGRATNSMPDEAALAAALQSMPLSDQTVAALLMQAAVGQVAAPSRLITAVIRIAGSAEEVPIQRAGFAPLVDAILAHAQNQIHALSTIGPFADIDLTCRAVERFHRLIRAIGGYVELTRNGRWAMICGALTKAVSTRVEPRLRDVVLGVNKALRRSREGNDRLDGDEILSALSNVYLLGAVREARDSLALNTVFDQAWTQVGEALEVHIQRNLDLLRQNPEDANTSERLEAAIMMAEVRFNPEYADVLRRAKEAAQRR